MNKKMRLILFALLAALLVLTACSTAANASSTQVTAPETFSDPFAYCAAVGQLDAPDGAV